MARKLQAGNQKMGVRTVVLCWACVAARTCGHVAVGSSESAQPVSPPLRFGANRTFKVVQFSDLHLDSTGDLCSTAALCINRTQQVGPAIRFMQLSVPIERSRSRARGGCSRKQIAPERLQVMRTVLRAEAPVDFVVIAGDVACYTTECYDAMVRHCIFPISMPPTTPPIPPFPHSPIPPSKVLRLSSPPPPPPRAGLAHARKRC